MVTYSGALKRSFSMSLPAAAKLQAQKRIILALAMQGWATRCYGSWEAAGRQPYLLPAAHHSNEQTEMKMLWSVTLHFCFVLKLCSNGSQHNRVNPGMSLCTVLWRPSFPRADTGGTIVPLTSSKVPRLEGLPKGLGSECVWYSLQEENKTIGQWDSWFKGSWFFWKSM